MNNPKILMEGSEVCFIVKPPNSDNMLVYREEGQAQDVADKLTVASGIDYMVMPSYLDPLIL